LWLALFPRVLEAIACAANYTCFQQSASLIWVMKNDGNINGPNCASECAYALCGSGTIHACNPDQPIVEGTNFDAVAAGLGFKCRSGSCWNSKTSVNQMWVSINNATDKTCYFPSNSTGGYDCTGNPGNANCFGERYNLVCPCTPATLETACNYQSPPYQTTVAKWSTPNMSPCLQRVNYWRQQACAQGWVECPPCGLPPMAECVSCHDCTNSEATYDATHGAHAAFTRCSELVAGEGGGATCGDVIDSFVAERAVFNDSNGVKVCRGHCGPIVTAGCATMFWGTNGADYYTLNWGACNATTCDAYCNDAAKTASGGVCRQDNWSWPAKAANQANSSNRISCWLPLLFFLILCTLY